MRGFPRARRALKVSEKFDTKIAQTIAVDT
jgi:hypothetical protein